MTFFDRLRERIETTGGLLAVGLNPDFARLPDDCRDYDYPRRAFNRRIVDATHEHVAAYALNPAYYSDSEGWTALAETVAYARGRGVPVVLDGKWADLPTAEADLPPPTANLFDRADAVTVSPYLGRDALAPVFDRDCGVFVVCRTPNAGATDLQDRELATEEVEESGKSVESEESEESGESLAEKVATLAGEWATDATADVGLLVGGPSETVESLRETAPNRPFFVVGGARNDPTVAEYATPADVSEADTTYPVGLVGVSREVLYAGETAGRGRADADTYASAARQAARRLVGQLERHR